jgi:hypothetical protein
MTALVADGVKTIFDLPKSQFFLYTSLFSQYVVYFGLGS